MRQHSKTYIRCNKDTRLFEPLSTKTWKGHVLSFIYEIVRSKQNRNQNNKSAVTCVFKQCGILTSVDSDEPSSLLVGLDTPNGVQSVA